MATRAAASEDRSPYFKYDMSRRSKVKMYRVRAGGTGQALRRHRSRWSILAASGGGRQEMGDPSLVGVVVEARQPASQRVHGRVCLRVLVHEVTQAFGQPAKRHLISTAALLEFLDPAVGEVHERSAACREHSVKDRGLLGSVHLRLPGGRG